MYTVTTVTVVGVRVGGSGVETNCYVSTTLLARHDSCFNIFAGDCTMFSFVVYTTVVPHFMVTLHHFPIPF